MASDFLITFIFVVVIGGFFYLFFVHTIIENIKINRRKKQDKINNNTYKPYYREDAVVIDGSSEYYLGTKYNRGYRILIKFSDGYEYASYDNYSEINGITLTIGVNGEVANRVIEAAIKKHAQLVTEKKDIPIEKEDHSVEKRAFLLVFGIIAFIVILVLLSDL